MSLLLFIESQLSPEMLILVQFGMMLAIAFVIVRWIERRYDVH
jgi:hypothetical protein